MHERTVPVLRLASAAVSAVVLSIAIFATAPVALAADVAVPELKRTNVKGAGVSVAFPSEWVRIDLSDADLESVGDAIGDDNPEIGDSLERIDSESIKLNAQDPVDGDSVTVLAGPGVLVGGKKFVRSIIESQLEGTPGFEVVRTRDLELGSTRAVRIDYHYEFVDLDGSSVPIYEIGVFVPIGDGKLANVDIAVDDEPADIALADRIARSVRRR